MLPLKSFLILLFFASSASVWGQTKPANSVKGRVMDEQHHLLPHATIILKRDSLNYKATQSDVKGGFSFDAVDQGSYILEISNIGFNTLREKIIVAQAHLVIDLSDLVLKSSIRRLDEVIVTASAPVVQHQLDKTVVNIGQNIITQGTTVWEALRKLPGVQVTADGQITMNGKPGVTLLIDGRPTYLSAEDLQSLLGGMQSSDIQRIELMTNPSSKYDASGTAGIINIVKKKNVTDGLSGSVNAAAGQAYYGRYNGGFSFNYRNRHLNLFAGNTYTYDKRLSGSEVMSDILGADGHLATEQVSINHGRSASRNYRPTFVLDVYLSKRSTLTLSGTAGFSTTDVSVVSGMDLLDSVNEKTGHIDFHSPLHDHPFNYTTGIQFVRQLDTSGRSLTISADLSQYRNSPLQINYNTNNDEAGNFISETDNLFSQHRRLDIYAGKADYIHPLKNKGSFEAGIKSSYVAADNNNAVFDLNGALQVPDYLQSDHSINSENINAAYVNLTRNWSDLSAEMGLRAEQTVTKGKELLSGEAIDLNYLQLFPTLFLNDKINEQHSLTLRLGRRTDRPDYHELVPFRRPLTATLFFQGDPDLKPQVSWHGELGWNFHQALTLTVNYDLYNNYIRTLPFLDSNETTITRRPINIRGAHSWEIDLTFNRKLLPWWSTDNTVAIYRNAFNGLVAGYSLDNKGLVSLQFNTNNSFRISSELSAECDFEYDTKRQYVNSTFGAYAILDVGIKKSLFAGKGSLTLGGNNILQSLDRNAIDRNAGLYQVSNLHFYSRSVSLSFAYRFGSNKTTHAKLESSSADEQKRAGN